MAHFILVNQVAQGVRPIEMLLSEVADLNDEQRGLYLADMTMIVRQAQARPEDVPVAIDRSRLKATFTPCVLATKKALPDAMARLRSLPRSEDDKSIRLLLALFQVADARRRLACGDTCTHWWHKDLGDEENVRAAIKSGGRSS